MRAALIIKLIFVLLIGFIVVEVILALRTLNQKPATQTDTTTLLRSTSGGKIALIADKETVKLGESVNVAVRIFTGGHSTDGTDLIINYDPTLIEATSSAIKKGTIYSDYPVVSVGNGKIVISGISGTSSFNGAGELANLNLKALKLGKSALVVDFTPADTTDSNIIESKTGKDILEEVSNLNITIGNTTSATVGSCSERTYQSCTDANGASGTFWCNNILDGFSCSAGCFKQKTGNETGCNVIVN